MSLTAPERETIITMNDEDSVAHIWTAQRPIITKLRTNLSAVLLNEGVHDGSKWAEFEIDAGLISIRSKKATRKPLTAEHKARMAAGRAKTLHT